MRVSRDNILFSFLLVFLLVNSERGFSQHKSTEQLREILSNEHTGTELAKAYEELISRYMRINTDSMYYFAEEYLDFANTKNDQKLILHAYYNLGRYYAVKGLTGDAIDYLNKAYELKELSESSKYTGQIIGMMGYVYYFDGQFDTAIKYYNEAISFFEQAKAERSLAIATSTIGSIYFQQEDFESAKNQYKKALDIKTELNDSLLMSTDIINLGLIYQREKKLDSALIYAKKGLQIDRKVNNIAGMSDTYGDMSSIYRNLGQHGLAIEFANLGLEKALEVNSMPLIRDAYEVQYHAYKEKKEFEKALQSYTNFKTYSDSITNVTSRQQLIEAREKYEAGKKEQEIQLLEAEKNAAELKFIFIILVGLGIVLIIGTTYWQTLRRRARERQLELQSIQRELSSYGVLIAEKDSLLSKLSKQLKELGNHLKSIESKKELNSLLDTLHQSVNLTEGEDQLFQRIEQVNSGFFTELESRFKELSKTEKRLASLVQMELSNKQIAGILNINPRSVVQARYRLKKKMELGTEDDLTAFLNEIGKN